MKLDLACGKNKQEGFIGVDRVKLPEIDQVVDLEKLPWPWKTNSIEEIWCSHYVEQVPDLVKFMDECHRILVPGGKMTIIAAYYTSIGAWQDPFRVRAICEPTFAYFNKAAREQLGVEHYEIKSDFDFVYGYAFTPEWQTRSEEARAFALLHYHNVASDIQVVMTKR